MQTYGNSQKRAKESKIQVVMDEFLLSKIGTLRYNSIENWKQIRDRWYAYEAPNINATA